MNDLSLTYDEIVSNVQLYCYIDYLYLVYNGEWCNDAVKLCEWYNIKVNNRAKWPEFK